jgi:hypothetical protein
MSTNRRKVNLRAVARAIEYFGGTLVINWRDRQREPLLPRGACPIFRRNRWTQTRASPVLLDVWGRCKKAPGVLTSHPCYAAAMIHDLITAIMVTSAAVLASELLVRIWDYF